MNEKDIEISDCDIIHESIPTYPWRELRNTMKTSRRTVVAFM
jgi:hypothetical protein